MNQIPASWQTALFALLTTACAVQAAPPPAPIGFDREIRPLLSDACFRCHGPDDAARQAELRLDQKEPAFRPADSGKTPVVPGRPELSEVYRRLTTDDPDQRMPPPDAPRQLNSREVEIIRAWIEQGASWSDHWAFQIPAKSRPIPEIHSKWGRNGIDAFTQQAMALNSRQPAPEADKRRLIRRVTFDLTGLPPTSEEVRSFLADDSPNAYERLVDRLRLVWTTGEGPRELRGQLPDGPTPACGMSR